MSLGPLLAGILAQGEAHGVVADPAIVVNVLGTAVSTATLAAYTFTGLDFGAADADRHIVCLAARAASGGAAITSITLNGALASLRTNPINASSVAIGIAKVPTGTTGLTASVTFAGSAAGCRIQLYRLTGSDNIIFDDPQEYKSTSGTINTNLSIAKGGAAFLVRAVRAGNAASGVAGLTSLDANNLSVSSVSANFYAGHYVNTGNAEPSHNFQLTSLNDRIANLIAAYRPA